MNGHIITDLTALIDGYVGVYETFLPDVHTIANDRVGIYLCTVTNHSTVTDDSKGTDIDIFPDSGLGRNTGKWVNPSFARFR